MMSHPATVRLSRPITSVNILGGYPGSVGSEPVDPQTDTPIAPSSELEAQKAMFSQVCQTLNDVATRLNDFYDKVIIEHREGITRLSVEIARKILMRKVENGDYEIESIVNEALKNAPARHDVIVHLNPEDFTQSQKAMEQSERGDAFVGIKFVSDPQIGRAECLLETPKGIVKSMIDENLERVSQALKKV
jgi:flagellar biosynthesis/type III secretory pathway protein FliH